MGSLFSTSRGKNLVQKRLGAYVVYTPCFYFVYAFFLLDQVRPMNPNASRRFSLTSSSLAQRPKMNKLASMQSLATVEESEGGGGGRGRGGGGGGGKGGGGGAGGGGGDGRGGG